jgi:hypothetical protein
MLSFLLSESSLEKKPPKLNYKKGREAPHPLPQDHLYYDGDGRGMLVVTQQSVDSLARIGQHAHIMEEGWSLRALEFRSRQFHSWATALTSSHHHL